MVHFSECSTVSTNCNTETQIETRDRTVEHFPELHVCVREAEAEGARRHREGAPSGERLRARKCPHRPQSLSEIGDFKTLQGVICELRPGLG